MKGPLGVFLALALPGAAALAQIGNPAGMGADTRMERPGTPAPGQTNNQDRLFARLAFAGGLAETQFARLAQEKAQAEAVRDFAAAMAEDHGAANDRLRELATARRIPLPEEPTPDQAAMRDRLAGLAGQGFDSAYIRGQIAGHQRMAQLLSWELSHGQDRDLKRQAGVMLPVVLGHLDRAQAIHAGLTGAGMRMPAAPAQESGRDDGGGDGGGTRPEMRPDD